MELCQKAFLDPKCEIQQSSQIWSHLDLQANTAVSNIHIQYWASGSWSEGLPNRFAAVPTNRNGGGQDWEQKRREVLECTVHLLC